jgi:hypothetical protein
MVTAAAAHCLSVYCYLTLHWSFRFHNILPAWFYAVTVTEIGAWAPKTVSRVAGKTVLNQCQAEAEVRHVEPARTRRASGPCEEELRRWLRSNDASDHCPLPAVWVQMGTSTTQTSAPEFVRF